MSVGVDRDRAFVVQIRLRHRRAVDLRAKQGPSHCWPPSRPRVLGPGSCTPTAYESARSPSQTVAATRRAGRRPKLRRRLTRPARIPHAEKQRETAPFQPRRRRGPRRRQGQEDRPRHAARRRRGRDRRRDRAARGRAALLRHDAHRDHPPVRRRHAAVPRRAADAAAVPALHRARVPGPGARASIPPSSRCARSSPRRPRPIPSSSAGATAGAASRPSRRTRSARPSCTSRTGSGSCRARRSGQGTGPLAARAAHLTRALADRFTLNETLLEVYPKGTLAALGFSRPYKKHLHERETRAHILESLADDLRFGPGVWRELCVQSDHLFEAVICAYTGYLWARDAWAAPVAHEGLLAGGWIWTPPGAGPRPRSSRPPTAERADAAPASLRLGGLSRCGEAQRRLTVGGGAATVRRVKRGRWVVASVVAVARRRARASGRLNRQLVTPDQATLHRRQGVARPQGAHEGRAALCLFSTGRSDETASRVEGEGHLLGVDRGEGRRGRYYVVAIADVALFETNAPAQRRRRSRR